jgi:hypothetical protein
MAPIILFLLGVSVIYLVSSLFYRYWRLKNVPGPFMASLTDFWMLKAQYFGPILPTLSRLHLRYGNVVRIGPNRVSLSSASHVKTIYTVRGEFQKVSLF